jgi:hypothetical protein
LALLLNVFSDFVFLDILAALGVEHGSASGTEMLRVRENPHGVVRESRRLRMPGRRRNGLWTHDLIDMEDFGPWYVT